ncbi:Unknown protein sequence [Pseudomonas savastanoi pv. savastanoi]|nr:Unknown protein sequence [Pseudomonas savastanoi pv. savastanoi]
MGMPFWTLRVRSCVCGAAQTCDAERHERHSHAGACGTIIPTVVPKFFSHRATLRVACRSGRSASGLAFVVRRRLVTQSVTQGIPMLERAER